MTHGRATARVVGRPDAPTRRADPASARADVEIFDIAPSTASARLAMDDVIELVHLGKLGDRWLICDAMIVPRTADAADRAAIDHVDGERVRATCHPLLSTGVVECGPAVDGRAFDWLRSITWEEIRILGETFNTVMQFDPAAARLEVKRFAADEGHAAAKLTAAS